MTKRRKLTPMAPDIRGQQQGGHPFADPTHSAVEEVETFFANLPRAWKDAPDFLLCAFKTFALDLARRLEEADDLFIRRVGYWQQETEKEWERAEELQRRLDVSEKSRNVLFSTGEKWRLEKEAAEQRVRELEGKK